MTGAKPVLVVIAGPTASGKTNLAIQVAKVFNTEIISVDSRQVYKEISIGTAKPSESELSAVKHHFINSNSIFQELNAGLYEQQALGILEKLFIKKNIAIAVGGTGLYIKALTKGLDHLPSVSKECRNELNLKYLQDGLDPLRQQLKQLDPEYYEKIDLNNAQRIIRALEICLTTGLPYSQFRKNSVLDRPFDTLLLCLNLPREELYLRINQRVDRMMNDGLLEEARTWYNFKEIRSLQTIGYSEMFDYLDGKYSLALAVEKIKQHTRNFAKRQLTWFRNQDQFEWLPSTELEPIINMINQKLAGR